MAYEAPSTAEAPQGQADPRSALIAVVCARIKEAVDGRATSGIEAVWQEDEDRYNGVDPDDPGSATRGSKTQPFNSEVETNGRSTVVLNITQPKTDAGVARVGEMLVPHDERPWEVVHSPIPELELALKDQKDRMLRLKDGTEATAEQVAKVTLERARDRAKEEEKWIEDRFVEGDVYGHIRKVIRDAGRGGTGVLKGPFPVLRERSKWSVKDGVATLERISKRVPTSVRKSVWDVFPDPACGDDIHAGGYFVERDFLTDRQLRKLSRDTSYDAEQIGLCLVEGPSAKARERRGKEQRTGDARPQGKVFEVWRVYMDMTFRELELLDFDTSSDKTTTSDADRALKAAPVIVEVINDRVIKVSRNPLEDGAFPFDFFVWDPVENQPWGRGIARKMLTAQVILIAAVRRMLENAGMASGPIVVTATGGIITPWDGRWTIEGRKGFHFKPNEVIKSVKDAVALLEMPVRQEELQAIIDFALRMADELTNLPMLMQGQMGSAPDILGGMQLLMANATAPLRVIAKGFDDQLMGPHLKRYHEWVMGDPDVPENAKGDHDIKARGSTVLVMRELVREFLAMVYPLIKDPALKINPEKYAKALFSANGFDIATIQYTEDEWKQVSRQLEQAAGQGDPKVAVAQIQAKDKAEERMWKAEQAAADRALQEFLAGVEREVQVLETAGQRQVDIDKIKALLATTAMTLKQKGELFIAERQFAETTGEGRGL